MRFRKGGRLVGRGALVTLLALSWSCDSATGPDGQGRGGQVRISTLTSGEDPDPDGYTYRIAGGASRTGPIGANDTVVVSSVSLGKHMVALEGLAENCQLQGQNPQSVTVPWNTQASFTITCSPRVGDLELMVTTGGEDPDPDGYEVRIDGEESGRIDPSGTRTFTLGAGTHSIELSDLSGNCSVAEGNPTEVSIPYQETASLSLTVNCDPREGDLVVSTVTDGEDIDSNGYTVRVDGGAGHSVASTGSVTISGVPEGQRSVKLDGVAENCQVLGENPRDVGVSFGETAETTFEIECRESVGDLLVTVSTSGADSDPDGYRVRVQGVASRSVEVDGTVRISDLPVGDHSVELTDVAFNCSVAGANPRAVEVAFGETVEVDFDVSCEETGGGGGGGSGPDGTFLIHSNRDGDFDIYRMNGDGSGLMNLTQSSATDLRPHVSRSGKVAFVSNRRFGAFLLYTMDLDGSNLERVDVGGLTGIDDPAWSPGGDKIAFSSDDGGNWDIFVVDLGSGSVTQLTSEASREKYPSWSPDGSRIVFSSTRNGNREIYSMRSSDGSDLRRLTNHPALDDRPTWGPGNLISFSTQRDGDEEIYLMQPDGTIVRNVTNSHATGEGQSDWTPDGNWVSFLSDRNGNLDIYVVRTNGSDVRRLTTHPKHDLEATWVP